MKQATIHGFVDVFALDLQQKKAVTVLDATEIVHQKQKTNPDDEVDRYGLTPDDYEFRNKESGEVYEIDHVLVDGETLELHAKGFD